MPTAILWRERGIKTGPDKPKDPDPTKATGIQVPDGAVLFGYNTRYDNTTAAGGYLDKTKVGISSTPLKNLYRKYDEIIDPRYAGGGVYLNSNFKPGDGTVFGTESIFPFCINDSNSYYISSYMGQINISSCGLNAYGATYNYTEVQSATVTSSNFIHPPAYKVVFDAKAGLTTQNAILQDWDYNRGSGKHGYLNPHPLGAYDFDATARLTTDIPVILGAAPGDTLSTTEKYTIHNKAHEGHQHEVTGHQISNGLANINFGGIKTSSAGDISFTTGGLNLLPVIPIVKDPRITNSTAIITSLPKGILVLGNDLAASDPNITLFVRDQYDPTAVPTTEDYSMHDYDHEANISTIGDSASSDNSQSYDNLNTYNGVPLYIVTRTTDVGVMSNGGLDTFKTYISSNTGGLHSHASTTTAFKSTKTGQRGAVLGDSGNHNHILSVSGNIYPRAKWLNGYITLKDETPLANGMIIAYSYQGNTLQFKDTTTTVDKLIPQYWHFCDGTNGTPDLRGYAIAVNMYESNMAVYDTEVTGTSYVTIDAMNVQPNSGENSMLYSDKIFKNYPIKTHTHVTSYETGTGTPIPMKGSHDLNPARWHVHELVSGPTIVQQVPNYVDRVKNTTTYIPITTNLIQTNTPYAWEPTKSNLAFIMLNKALP